MNSSRTDAGAEVVCPLGTGSTGGARAPLSGCVGTKGRAAPAARLRCEFGRVGRLTRAGPTFCKVTACDGAETEVDCWMDAKAGTATGGWKGAGVVAAGLGGAT
jgi:hypothetical protein